MKNYILIIPLLFFLYVQNYAQWKEIQFPSTCKVTSLAVKDSMIFAGTDGDGIFISTDNGDSWKSINEGLDCLVIQNIFVNELPPSSGQTKIFAGTGTGASFSTDNGMSWNTITNGLTNEGVWSFAAGETASGYTTLFAGTWSGNVYKSTDNGKSWVNTNFSATLALINKAQSKLSISSFVTVCHMTAIGESVYASTIVGRLLLSSNNGVDWRDQSFYAYEPIMDGWGTLIGWGKEIKGLKPIYALDKINSTAVVSAGYGEICYKPKNSNSFLLPKNDIISKNKIFSFTVYDGKIFAGSYMGEIFLSEDDGVNWENFYTFDHSIFGNSVYSIAVNNSCIMVSSTHGIWRLKYSENVTAVDKFHESPTGFSLGQNYPNPFNPSTVIRYQLPVSGNVSIKVFDVLGREVATLVDEYKQAGSYNIQLSTNNYHLPSGIYFYSLVTNEFRSTRKLMLLK